MRKLFFGMSGISAAALIIFVSGCTTSEVEEKSSHQASTSSDIEVVYSEVNAAEGAEKHVADLAIAGMSCEMMCGGKISQTLAELSGVKNTEIKFAEGEETNHAIVEYDATSVSEKEMIAAINGIAGGVYSVKSVEVTHYKASSELSFNRRNSDEQRGYSTPTLEYKLPNIFGVFTRAF